MENQIEIKSFVCNDSFVDNDDQRHRRRCQWLLSLALAQSE